MCEAITAILVDRVAWLSLAQTGRKIISPQEQKEIYFWLMIIVIVGLVLGSAGYFIWRRFKKLEDAAREQAPSFSLASMRRLYEEGEISHEEFMHIKARLIGEARDQMLGEPEVTVEAADAAPQQETESPAEPGQQPPAESDAPARDPSREPGHSDDAATDDADATHGGDDDQEMGNGSTTDDEEKPT